ncbi:DUF1643 domain-containing protein [Roseobacter sp. HKCCD9010]|uniref:DUF1643 domain-containing protein n=1 Tax=unclassified Roseobacter TaxID=196798 RepID=UPI0014931407|nr:MULTISPECIES: DUF1643 domain-containing protein [unclassified Roseobacter]MBF9050606.1 DUF1643 domain-containing protein [Rhodobacterales bacterium HKCCD4356]NNV11975.1 DUF1643 domain-containing protein [Roseobacter sp. HKCCD7357]NNV16988.1 DUF1643 domain-containing protein [Roseobacter sp. HKCCD8768]NNV26218.1 DUF1643 domain-containing protein [Roseobacter sp. HKCCD8192]NNV30713.1 DUF1643 domain-containing protein [Roseobacter sp. HKCCD9061]
MLDLAGNGAVISECGQYRYRLDRHIGCGEKVFAFFGVNPSTADASLDDATVRKWRGFSQRLAARRFIVGNAFAFRATDVRALASEPFPMGPEWRDHIDRIVEEADFLVPCWGASGKLPRELHSQLYTLMSILRETGKPLFCWGLTASGDPKHPLMLSYDTPLVSLSGAPS